jgi:hypothetical protein
MRQAIFWDLQLLKLFPGSNWQLEEFELGPQVWSYGVGNLWAS